MSAATSNTDVFAVAYGERAFCRADVGVINRYSINYQLCPDFCQSIVSSIPSIAIQSIIGLVVNRLIIDWMVSRMTPTLTLLCFPAWGPARESAAERGP